jgi:hypothetical protein
MDVNTHPGNPKAKGRIEKEYKTEAYPGSVERLDEELISFLNQHPEINSLFSRMFEIKVRPSQADEVSRKYSCLLAEAGLAGAIPCYAMRTFRLAMAREIRLAYKGHTPKEAFQRFLIRSLIGTIAMNGPTSQRAKLPQMKSRHERISAMCRECGSCFEDGLRSHADCSQEASDSKLKSILQKITSILPEVIRGRH